METIHARAPRSNRKHVNIYSSFTSLRINVGTQASGSIQGEDGPLQAHLCSIERAWYDGDQQKRSYIICFYQRARLPQDVVYSPCALQKLHNKKRYSTINKCLIHISVSAYCKIVPFHLLEQRPSVLVRFDFVSFLKVSPLSLSEATMMTFGFLKHT